MCVTSFCNYCADLILYLVFDWISLPSVQKPPCGIEGKKRKKKEEVCQTWCIHKTYVFERCTKNCKYEEKNPKTKQQTG